MCDRHCVMLYHHFDRDNTIDPHVLYQLKAYHDFGIDVIFFSDAELNDAEYGKITGFVSEMYAGTRQKWLEKNKNRLEKEDRLLLADCSCYGPQFPLDDFFAELEKNECDFLGVSCNSDEPHYIPEHFIGFNSNVFHSAAFAEHVDAVDDGRTLYNALTTTGFRGKVLCEHDGMDYCQDPRLKRALNAFVPAYLIRQQKMPLVRMDDLFAWKDGRMFNESGEIEQALLDSGSPYPVSQINTHFRRVKTLLQQKNLSDTLFVAKHGAANRTETPLKQAVLAHFFYPDLFDEVLSYLRNFPFQFDFLISTSSEENSTVLRRKIMTAGLPVRQVEIRVVVNRGRDVGPWLTAFNDLQEQYDQILKIHSKKSGKTPEVLPYEWSRNIYDSLMGSPALIQKIVETFEHENRLGIVFPIYPPVLQIGAPLWFSGMKVNVIRQWLDRCGIKADVLQNERIPLFPVGTMFWYRPKALAALFHCGFHVEEFPPEPFPAEGTAAHALERAVPYIAQGNGYYFKQSISLENLKNSFLRYEDHMMTRNAALDEKDLEIDRLNETIWNYEHSLCWRITKPLRLLFKAIKFILGKKN